MHLSHALQIQRGDVVALSGGGGKTTALFRLGRELAEAQQRVLLTTTSSLVADLQQASIPYVTFDPGSQSLADIIPHLQQGLDQAGQVLLIGTPDREAGSVPGVSPEIVDALAASGLFDIIVCKTGLWRDSIREMPGQEVLVPASTSRVVPVLSLDRLLEPVRDEDLGREALGAAFEAIFPTGLVTPEAFVRLTTWPGGILQRSPVAASIIPLLNKLDQVDPATAQSLARRLLDSERILAVAVGSIGRESGIAWVENRVAAVVLAAGQASRFGSPKQLALWQDKPLLAHVVDAALASSARPVLVVLGAHAAACRQILADRPVQIVMNKQWAEGQSTSMKAGLAALPANISAAIFPLADQPFITPNVIDAVIGAYQRTLRPVVWPEYEGRRGNPVLFDRRLFAEMNQIRGDVGARPVLMAHQAEAERVAVAEPGILQDIDRPEDL